MKVIQSTTLEGKNNSHIALDYSSLKNVKPDTMRSIENIDYQKAKMFTVRVKETSSIFDDDNSKSLVIFLNSEANNLSILVDFFDINDNVISQTVYEQIISGQILDFTVVEQQKP